jgi:hypothetical protein
MSSFFPNWITKEKEIRELTVISVIEINYLVFVDVGVNRSLNPSQLFTLSRIEENFIQHPRPFIFFLQ